MLLDDFATLVEKVHDDFWSRYRQLKSARGQVASPLVEGNNFKLDSSGNGDFFVYLNQTGKHLEIGRVIILADGYTPASAWNGGYLYLYTGIKSGSAPNFSSIFDYLPASPGGQVFPNVAEYSGHNAIRLKQNETLSCYISGGPANTNIYVGFFGFLEPTTSDDTL